MRQLLHWLDENLLFLITGFLLAFIPLFPKLPLFEAIPGYIVRVRLEDFLIGFTLIVWLVQLIRKKAAFGPNPLAKPILAYLTVGVLSMISAVYIIPTVPNEGLHVGKMVLHFLRRVEYFSLFFVFYSSVKSIKQVKIYLTILVFTIVGVTLYGYGQKYLYWPAFSTMNREFSKGWALYLTQHARVLSTFGGHYDLAAYSMIGLIILWALFFSVYKKLLKVLIFLVISGLFWLLILTASRTSFIAYIAGVTVLFALWVFRRGIIWSVSRWFLVVVMSILVMLSFGDLSDRFTKLLKLDQRLGGIKYLLLKPFGKPPTGEQIALLENNLQAVTSRSDFPPLPIRPSDVTDAIPEGLIASQSATGAAIITEVSRTYSHAALVYDLSTGIRLDALWPRAIAGFKRNPLVGSGYSTLTKTQFNEFTEAESTDNDFLRTLGETGILGFLAFGWILGTVVLLIWKTYTRVRDPIIFGFIVAMGAAVFALLVNAVYIDIFESSKIAFTFWALVGIVLGGIKVTQLDGSSTKRVAIPDWEKTVNLIKTRATRVIKSDKTYLLLFLVLAYSVRLYKIDSPLADWHSWRQADTSAVTRNFVRWGLDPLTPRYDDLSSVASGKPNPQGYRFVEFPIYNIAASVTDKLFPGYNVEHSGRLTSIFMSLGTLIFLYLLVKKYLGVGVALFTAFFFAVLPYNIYWSRVILPEPTLVFLTTAMLYYFDVWVDTEKKRFWLASVIFAILALLTKFTTAFLVIPMFYLAWKKWGLKLFTRPWLYLYGILVIMPFFAWRSHIARFPEGIPAYTWLFNGNGIRFKGAWFWWIFADRVAKIILGGWGVVLLVLGLIKPIRQAGKGGKSWFFHWWGVGMLVYLMVFATGNVQHDYYQVILVPILSVFLGIGAEWLLTNWGKTFHPLVGRLLLFACISFTLMFGWYQARDFFNINHPEIVVAGQAFQKYMGDKKGNVIAPYGGDTAFLYQTGQRGWPLIEGSIDDMLKRGAHYYISTNYDDFTNQLLGEIGMPSSPDHQFKLIEKTDQYVIIQLVPDKLLPKP